MFRSILCLVLALGAAPAFAQQQLQDSACPPSVGLAPALPGAQEFATGGTLDLPDGRALVLVRLKPAPVEALKIWGFYLIEGNCIARAVTVGAYPAVSQMMRDAGKIGADELMFHGDLYSPDGHSTLEWFGTQPPSFETAQALALSALGLK